MSSEFSELNRRLEELKKWHLRAVGTFALFETIQELRAPNIQGKIEARSNATAIGRYRGLFNIAEVACCYELQMTLAKIFVAHKDSLYLERLVNFAEQNRKKLTAKDFKEFHEGRNYLDELVSKYEGLSSDSLREIKKNLDNHKGSIQRLKTIRNQQLAHINLSKPDDVVVTNQEIADLIELSEKIINTLSVEHFKSSNMFEPFKNQVVDDTESLVALARLEAEHPREVRDLLEKHNKKGDKIT